jgi:ABC-2 type transport system ATP-binding protein
MRADLAAALLHNPPIVFLDEPTIGLDIAVKSRIREFIKQLNKEQGTTILLTTHDLDDIKDLCSRMVIIDKGKLLYDGELQTITDAFAKERTIHFQVAEASPLIAEAIRQLPGAELEKEAGHTFSVRFDRFRMSAGEVAAAVMRVAEVVDFRIDEPSVEHIIRQVYDGHLELPQVGKEALR